MNIGIIGTGYVGMVTGTCLAETGNKVFCVDIDQHKIENLKNGYITIYEPGLEKLFKRNILEKRLFFTTNLEEVFENLDIIFLALPTPPKEDGSADLQYVLHVAQQIGKLLKSYKIIITKSTVPVGTAVLVENAIKEHYHGSFDIVSNPEFLREGVAVEDFMKPDRIVIGLNSDKPKQMLTQLYEPFVRQGNPLIFMDTPSAELTKYAANAFLATKISFMNEIANLCEKVNANVDLVRKGISHDDRIGKRFLFPGIGYGGSCFPKDVRALENIAAQYNYDFKILKAVTHVNQLQKNTIVEKMMHYFDNNLKGLNIAIWGISFKPNTDDIREAPAIHILMALLNAGAKVAAFDPEAMENFKKLHPDLAVNIKTNQYEALNNVDALIIATEWNEFRTPDFSLMKQKMKVPLIFDGRNIYSQELMKEHNFIYFSIGRP
ncbi:MAG: UDP-glucose/GDP-mannose dehydrogenase family protein [Alphaproteobacteria bacterium]|nr:UDP-glucose/GDP-mannose dehydrogenase family protein [Alphaproteobacteria bacterium]